MASNAKLTEDIKEINPEAETDGLNNAQLADLLKSLKAAKELAPDPEPTPAPTPEPTPEPEAPKAKKGYFVAEGKSITSMRGIRVGGQPVEAKYFPDGENTIKDLVKRGMIIKK